MKKDLVLILILVGLFLPQMAQDQQSGWSVRLKLPQSEYLPGEPVVGLYIEMENMGPKPSPFPGFKGNLFLDDSKEPCKYKGLFVDTIPGGKSAVVQKKDEVLEEVGALHTAAWEIDIADYCGLSEGKDSILGLHTLHYRFPEDLGTHIADSHTPFKVMPPTGADKEAYDYFKGKPLKSGNCNDLLKKFPSSTYTAYVVYGCLKGFAGTDFSNPTFLRSLETGAFLSNSYPTEGGWSWMKDEMNTAWWSKWAGIILKNHPDIWFADELRLKLAMNQVALKNYQAAEADFIKLSKEAKPYIAEKAALFVEIMKQKGWVTAPVEKGAPESKEEK